jgi:hypothetical protein
MPEGATSLVRADEAAVRLQTWPANAPWAMRHPVWASIAWVVPASAVVHLVATFLPVGRTPPLVAGFFVAALVIWTIPASAVFGLILGLLLRFAVRRLGRQSFFSRRNRLVLAGSYGLLAGGGLFLIFTRVWVAEVNFLAGVVGFCLGFAFVLLGCSGPWGHRTAREGI